MRLYRKSAYAAFVIGMAVLCSTGSSQARGDCLPWDSARHIIKKEGLASPDSVRRGLQAGASKLLDVRLCRERGRYVYRVVTRQGRGRVNKVIVDATSGRRLGLGAPKTRGFKSPIPADVGKSPLSKTRKKFFKLFRRRNRR